jgi:hypothetical protein
MFKNTAPASEKTHSIPHHKYQRILLVEKIGLLQKSHEMLVPLLGKI